MPDLKPRMTAKTPGDIAALIPLLFGFVPHDSLVVISFDDTNAISLSMRIDLGPIDELIDGLDRYLPSSPDEITRIVVAAFTDDDAYCRQLHAELAHNYVLREFVRIEDGRWFSILCSDPSCCDPAGTLVAQPAPEMVAAMGLREPVGSREDLRLLYERTDPISSFVLDVLTPEPRVTMVARFERMLSVMKDAGTLSEEAIAQALVNLQDVGLRDVLMGSMVLGEVEPDAEELFTVLCRRAPEQYFAPAATCAALMGWMAGSGTRARLAIEAALEADPGYRLALLALHALDAGVPPTFWRNAFADLAS